MRTLIVFFSLDGNTRSAARIIADKLGADLLELQPVKPFPTGKFLKYFLNGMKATFGYTVKLKPYMFDPGAYEAVIICTPVWASSVTPPVRTFLKNNKLGSVKLGIVTCSGGGDAAKAPTQILSLAGRDKAAAELTLFDGHYAGAAGNDASIEIFCRKIA